MPTNFGRPTACESHAERPAGRGSPRARTTHSIMALSLFEQVPVLLSTRFVRDPNSTSRPQRGPLVSRSTTLPQWLLDWACSLPLSARCPTQPCHPQPPRRPLTRHGNGRGDLRGVPRPKAVRGPPRECRHSAAGWPKRCLVGGLPAWLPGWRGRQGAGGSRFRCTHSRTSPAVASSGRRSANSRTPRIERWQIASSTAL